MSDFRVVCDSCGTEFLLGSVGIKTTSMELDEGLCEVVFFCCPNASCRRIHLVAIEDTRWKELKQDLDKHLRFVHQRWGIAGAEEAARLNRMTERKHKRLSRHVEYLKRKYDGRFTLVTTENSTEELTLTTMGDMDGGK